MKRIPLYLLLGYAIGSIVTALIAPSVLHWYSSVPYPAAMNCDPAVNWAVEKLITTLAWGAGIGALVFLVGGLIIGRMLSQRRALKTKAEGTDLPVEAPKQKT